MTTSPLVTGSSPALSLIHIYIVVGKAAPEICPVCNHPRSYFEVREENY